MSYECILTDVRGDAALKTGLITLYRPKALNALNDQLMDELGAALLAFDRDDGIGCVVVTGSEKAFGAGGTQRLPRAVGKSKAMEMVLTGRMMDAAEAERAGLVSRVVPADKLLDEALDAATIICALSGPSVMMAKEAVNRAFESGLSDGVAFERRLFHSLFGTHDQKEGMSAFLAKSKPVFTQR